MPGFYHDTSIMAPPPSLSSPSKHTGIMLSSSGFTTNMLFILGVIFIALILSLALTVIIRLLICCLHSTLPNSTEDPEKQNATSELLPVEKLPTLQFSTRMTELAGAGTECAICLVEFAEGDGVKVLPACQHGFHVKCIEGWLSASSSCPMCRRCCLVPAEDVGRTSIEDP